MENRKVKDEEKVMHISGTNVEGVSKIKESYFFSNCVNVWGWASWRRAWNRYDVEMKKWRKYNSYRGMIKLGHTNLINNLRLRRIFKMTYNDKINTWDYQWDFCCKENKGYSLAYF